MAPGKSHVSSRINNQETESVPKVLHLHAPATKSSKHEQTVKRKAHCICSNMQKVKFTKYCKPAIKNDQKCTCKNKWSHKHVTNSIHSAHHAKRTSSKSPRPENALILRDVLKKCKFKIWTENAAAKRRTHRIEHDPTITATRPFAQVKYLTVETHFAWESTTSFRAPAIYPDFTKCCACH